MNIRYIKQADIDKERWDTCIDNSLNGLIYARSWYLDHICTNWDAIVLDNYEAVLPLPWRKKMGIKYVYPPVFAQQLGLFCTKAVNAGIVNECLQLASKHFKFIELYINQPILSENNKVCTNYILHLDKDYETIKQQLSGRFIQSLKRAARYSMHYKAADEEYHNILDIYQQQYAEKSGTTPEDLLNLKNIFGALLSKNRLHVRNVINDRSDLLASVILMEDNNRLYNIINIIEPNGRTLEANYFLYNEVLKEFSNQNFVLDFEGSDLPGVAKFYQKFNAVYEPFYFYKVNNLPFYIKWLKH